MSCSDNYGLDANTYADMAALGMTADRSGLMITSLENLPSGEDGAELLLVAEGLIFAFVVEVRPATITLFLVPVDGNSASNRLRILGTENTPQHWQSMTGTVVRLGRWQPREEWQDALSNPVELGDLIVCA